MTTVIILNNNTTGMTGHQDHPGTGKTLRGEPTHKLDIEALVRAIGIEFVHKVNPYNLKKTEETISEAIAYKGPAVVITEHPCIMLKSERVKPKIPFSVNPEICNQCGNCLDFGCPAMTKVEGKPPTISPLLCIGCSMCAQLCEVKAIKPKN